MHRDAAIKCTSRKAEESSDGSPRQEVLGRPSARRTDESGNLLQHMHSSHVAGAPWAKRGVWPAGCGKHFGRGNVVDIDIVTEESREFSYPCQSRSDDPLAMWPVLLIQVAKLHSSEPSSKYHKKCPPSTPTQV